MPEDITTIVKTEDRLARNEVPKEIKLADGMYLYHQLDQVYLKPKTIIDILLRVKQPDNRYTKDGKAVSFLRTPADFTLFKVMKDCLESTITGKVGFEAKLANCTYSVDLVEEMAVHIRINGYSDKLFDFATIFLDIMSDCAKENGFEEA